MPVVGGVAAGSRVTRTVCAAPSAPAAGAVSVRRVTDLARTARLDVLVEGYARRPNVAGTVSLVRDEGRVIVVDPGMVADRDLILRPLRDLGVRPEDVTDVVVSHHHLDHTVNIALFPVVPVHDFQSVIEGDTFTRRPADGVQLTPGIRLLATPGHTPQDITTLVGTPDDVVALTHLWWTEQGPADDPYCTDREQLRQQRERVLDLATLVLCAHGPAFRPSSSTPR
jgi:glyoxylase-like metal-dependent hydrolase (beta-lactamase superfamily II)